MSGNFLAPDTDLKFFDVKSFVPEKIDNIF